MSGDDSEADFRPTLYDPPESGGDPVPKEHADVEMDLELPPDLAAQLLEVSMHLGLSPSIVASRAIEMVCAQVGLVQSHDLSSETLIQKYQTRIDLLHRLEDAPEPKREKRDTADVQQSEDKMGWEGVDEIIKRGERL